VHQLGEHDRLFERFDLRLEHGLIAGTAILLAGLVAWIAVLITWVDRGFGALAEEKLAVLSLTLIVVGLQVIFTSFLLSIVGLRRTDR
jgi:hypothetical protein